MIDQNTICAISTAPGMGAIALIRLSGSEAFEIVDQVFEMKKKSGLAAQKANTVHFGNIKDQDEVIDEVVISVFKSPHSYTGEHIAEIACHGSTYIQQRILQLLIKKGARTAKPGEFTQRAFLNGKMDLSQAEAVADLISSQSGAAHQIAMNQMKGGVSEEIKSLRQELLTFISLVELELDFSEEDVEFADRTALLELTTKIHEIIINLSNSFQLGNAIKNGIPVAIVGDTNVGKSTLLNKLLKEDKAIVSDIAGTTRDVIEDVMVIDGILFRFIDTAGIRNTSDTIENIGIERSFSKLKQADLALVMIDATRDKNSIIEFLNKVEEKAAGKNAILVINKTDIAQSNKLKELSEIISAYEFPSLKISAKENQNITELIEYLVNTIKKKGFSENSVLISNARHYESLANAQSAIERVIEGLNAQISGDFLSQDIRECSHYLGEITGDISNEEVLGNIFKNFCIGK